MNLVNKRCMELYEECMKNCGGDCLDLGLDAECRLALRDCLGNPGNYEPNI